MEQTNSKLGTGLKSTGDFIWREGIQAYQILVYTKFLTGPDFYVYFWVSARHCVIQMMKKYNKTIQYDAKDNPQTICTTANNGLNTIEEIAEKYKLNQKEAKVANLLAMNTKELPNVKLMAENGIPEKTFYRMKNRIKSKIISWQNEKSDSICEKNDCL